MIAATKAASATTSDSVAPRGSKEVGAAQPVEQAGGKGIARADGVHEVYRDRRAAQLAARGDRVDARVAAGDHDERGSPPEPVAGHVLV